MKTPAERVRLDKFLWAARFYKTRSLAAEDIDKGRVAVNGQTAKASRELKPGDLLALRQGPVLRSLRVLVVSDQRGPASVARTLYEETPESLAARERHELQRRLAPEPALTQTQGRPTKRNRRELQRSQGTRAWDDRWSASLDD